MKVIQNFVLINIYIIHFIDKVCWTSQILEENSWKNVTFCCLFWCTSRRRLVFVAWSKTHNKNMSHFFKIFLQGFVKFSKVFHWFHVAKCYSELKNEELSSLTSSLKFFRKLNYWDRLFLQLWIHFCVISSLFVWVIYV